MEEKELKISQGINPEPHSCKISINAKGQWAGEVKVYAENPDEAVKKTLEKAEELAKKLAEENGQTE